MNSSDGTHGAAKLMTIATLGDCIIIEGIHRVKLAQCNQCNTLLGTGHLVTTVMRARTCLFIKTL